MKIFSQKWQELLIHLQLIRLLIFTQTVLYHILLLLISGWDMAGTVMILTSSFFHRSKLVLNTGRHLLELNSQRFYRLLWSFRSIQLFMYTLIHNHLYKDSIVLNIQIIFLADNTLRNRIMLCGPV